MSKKSESSKKNAIKRAAVRSGVTVDQWHKLRSEGKKYCWVCVKWISVKEYNSDKSRSDGLSALCRKCEQNKDKKRYIQHPRDYVNNPVIMPYPSEETLAATRKRNRENKWCKGRKVSEDQKQRLSNYLKEIGWWKGSHSPNWKGGVTPINRKERQLSETREWRDKVFARDNYTCQLCGDARGGNLNAHHIKPWAKHPSIRRVLENGITLCRTCHVNTHKGSRK